MDKTPLGIAVTALFETQFLPFMLSSATTARTLVKEKNQTEEVQKDLFITLWVSFGFSILMAVLLKDSWTAVFGITLGTLLDYLYTRRGDLPGG